MKIIENYETVDVLLTYGNNVSSLSYEINLDFIPDEMILKNVSKFDNNNGVTSDQMILFKTDLVNAPVFCHFPKTSSFHETYDIPFKMNKPIRGNYRFYFTKMNGDDPNNITTFDTKMAFTLLFLKYK